MTTDQQATLDKKQLAALRLMHPYGLTGRTLLTTGKLTREQLRELAAGGYIVSQLPGCYDLTDAGRKAAGIG